MMIQDYFNYIMLESEFCDYCDKVNELYEYMESANYHSVFNSEIFLEDTKKNK